MFSSPRSLILALVALAALAAPPAANAQGNPGDPLARLPGAVGERGDPVAVAAYGVLLDADLKPIEPTPEFLRSTLDLYIDRLTREADDRTREALERHRQALAEAFPADEMTQRFLILEFLTTSVAPQDQAYLEARNHIMRRAWYKGLLGLERFRAETDRRSNLPFDIRDFGLRNGLIRAATRAAGREYIEECRKAGVPIPPDWGSSGWSHEGDLTTNFLGFGNPAQVWRADSASPKGLCVALPRVDGANISALGIICLGVEFEPCLLLRRLGRAGGGRHADHRLPRRRRPVQRRLHRLPRRRESVRRAPGQPAEHVAGQPAGGLALAADQAELAAEPRSLRPARRGADQPAAARQRRELPRMPCAGPVRPLPRRARAEQLGGRQVGLLPGDPRAGGRQHHAGPRQRPRQARPGDARLLRPADAAGRRGAAPGHRTTPRWSRRRSSSGRSTPASPASRSRAAPMARRSRSRSTARPRARRR